MTYNVLSGTLNPTHLLTYLLTYLLCPKSNFLQHQSVSAALALWHFGHISAKNLHSQLRLYLGILIGSGWSVDMSDAFSFGQAEKSTTAGNGGG